MAEKIVYSPIEDTTLLKIVALICMTIIVCFALYNGIDSVLLAAAMGIIGTIFGWSVKSTVKG